MTPPLGASSGYKPLQVLGCSLLAAGTRQSGYVGPLYATYESFTKDGITVLELNISTTYKHPPAARAVLYDGPLVPSSNRRDREPPRTVD